MKALHIHPCSVPFAETPIVFPKGLAFELFFGSLWYLKNMEVLSLLLCSAAPQPSLLCEGICSHPKMSLCPIELSTAFLDQLVAMEAVL